MPAACRYRDFCGTVKLSIWSIIMVRRRLAVRVALTVGICLLLGLYPWPNSVGAEEALTIQKSEEYFPDTLGSRWTYRGQISEGPLQTIELKFFTNVSTVSGTKTIN